MNKKILKILIFVVLVLILLSLSFYLIKNKNSYKSYEEYEKYSLTITVDTTKDKSISSTIIKVYDDNKNLKIISTDNNYECYIIGNKMYYLKNNIFYIYEINKSYRELYNVLRRLLETSKSNSDSSYSVSSKAINQILECIYSNSTSNTDGKIKTKIVNNRIDEIYLNLKEIGTYDSANINLKYEKLDESYKIDTSKIYSSNGTGIHYKFINTDENPYEILKKDNYLN